MPTVSEEIITEVQMILKLCMELKTVGADAFFEWHSHVYWMEVRVCETGWWQDSSFKHAKDFRVFLDKDHAVEQLQEIKQYLTALLKKNSKSVHAI